MHATVAQGDDCFLRHSLRNLTHTDLSQVTVAFVPRKRNHGLSRTDFCISVRRVPSRKFRRWFAEHPVRPRPPITRGHSRADTLFLQEVVYASNNSGNVQKLDTGVCVRIHTFHIQRGHGKSRQTRARIRMRKLEVLKLANLPADVSSFYPAFSRTFLCLPLPQPLVAASPFCFCVSSRLW